MKVRTSVLRGMALLALGSLTFAACDDKTPTTPVVPQPISVTVTPASATIPVGGQLTLVAFVQNSTNQAVTWTSTNTAVATVDAQGVVRGVTVGGPVTIIATSQADPNARAAASITVQTAPGQEITFTLVPQQAQVQVGGTVQLVGIVTGSTNQAVTYASSTPAVATVSATGLVTGVSTGTAVITATPAAAPGQVRTATITVTPAAPPASVSFQAVTGHTTTPTGNFNVTLNVSADVTHDVRRVQVRLRDQVVCEQVFAQPLGTTQGVATFSCEVDTAALDEQGQPLFPNGTAELTAVALDGAGAVRAQASWGNITLNNVNRVDLTITTTPVSSETGVVFAGGLEWREGAVVVTATPVIFQAGQTVASVVVCLDVPEATAAPGSETGTSCRTVTTTTEGRYVATFPKTAAVGGTTTAGAGVRDVSNTNVRAYVSGTTLATGAAGPTAPLAGTSPSIRLDNLAPVAPTTVNFGAGQWFGATSAFSRATITTHTAAELEALDPQPGVGGVTLTFHAFAGTEAQYTALGTSDAARMAAVVAQGTQVATGADLAGTETPTGYILVVRARDAAGNTRLVRVAGQFGVDPVPPDFTIVAAIATGSPADNTINPATAFQFEFPFVEGNVSGTIFNPEVRIRRWTSNPAAVRCINVNTGADVAVPTAGCDWIVAAGTSVTVRPEDGYYEYSFRFRDNAGNVSRVETRIVMRDNTAPVVAVSGAFSISESSIVTGGTITDNVDIRGWDQRLQFTGAAAPSGANDATLPIAPMQVVGSFGAADRVGTFTIPSTTINFWRTLTVSAEGTGPQTIGARTTMSGAGFGGFDVARNFHSAYRAITPDATGAATPAGLETLDVTLSGTTFCNGITPRPSGDQGVANCVTAAPADPATRTVTVIAEGATGFVRPFAAVHFYRVDPNGNVTYLGQTTASTSGSVGDRFQHRWTFTVDATGWQGSFAENDQGIFAVGVTAATDAFRTPVRSITVRGAANQPSTGNQP
jgi:hypothetical protein